MALSLPADFYRGIQGKDTNLVPFVIIGEYNLNPDDWIYLSTNNIIVKKMVSLGLEWGVGPIKNCSPILLNVPSLKESIDIETRNYKISNVTLDISNYEYNGKRFSDLIGDNPLINEECRIYWTNPAVTDNKFNTYDVGFPMEDDHAFEVYFGTIRRYEITGGGDKVKLVVEDRSQATLHKDLPLTKIGTDAIVPDKYKNKYVPMVYGSVDRSPCVFDGTKIIISDYYLSRVKVETIDDIVDNFTETLPALFVYNNDVYSYILETPVEDLKTYEAIGVDTSNASTVPHLITSSNQWEFATATNEIKLLSNPLIGMNVLQCVSISIPNINIVKLESSIEQEDNIFQGFGVQFDVTSSETNTDNSTLHENNTNDLGHPRFKIILGVDPAVEYISKHTLYVSLNGLLLPARGSGEASFATDGHMNDRVYVAMAPNWGWHEDIVVGLDRLHHINEVGLAGHNLTAELFGYEQFNDPASQYDNIRQLTGEINFITSLEYEGSYTWTQELNSSVDLYFYDWASIGGNLNDQGIRANDNNQYVIFIRQHYQGNTSTAYPLEIESDLQMIGTINNSTVKTLVDIEKINNKDYYANVSGRISDLPRADEVIKNIMTELNPDVGTNIGLLDDEYTAWKYQFTVTKKISSKKLIEGIASASPYIPRFDNMGNFKFDVIKSSYGITDLTDTPGTSGGNIVPNTTILEEDCIDWSYSRTPIEDVKTAVELKYHFDYGRDDYIKDLSHSVKPDDSVYGSKVLDMSILGNYSNDYYGLKTIDGDPHAESTLIIDEQGKYIRSNTTAYNFAEWMLLWNCNQHLKIKVKLPLKYMNLEIGDIVEYEELLGGVAPYGISYQKGSPSQGRTINGQIAYPYFMILSTNKTLKWVEIETIMMHKLASCQSGNYDCAGTCAEDSSLMGTGYGDGTEEHPEGVGWDICGVCGAGVVDVTQCTECPPGYEPDCFGVCGGSAVVDDECGVCGGNGAEYICWWESFWGGDPVCSEADCLNIALQEDVCSDARYNNESDCVASGATWWINGCYLECLSCNYSPLPPDPIKIQLFSQGEIVHHRSPNSNNGCSEAFQIEIPMEHDPSGTFPFNRSIDDLFVTMANVGTGWTTDDMTIQLIDPYPSDKIEIVWGTYNDNADAANFDTGYTYHSFLSTAETLFNYRVGDGYLQDGDEFTLYLKLDYKAHDYIAATDQIENYFYTDVVPINFKMAMCGAAPGDINGDLLWNVQDIVILANCVLAPNCDTNCLDEETGEGIECYGCAGLISEDTGWNILDMVILANCILNNDCGDQ